MYTAWLGDEYTIRTASNGEETLQNLDSDVGVVVLDRRMPGLSGDEVLDWIRSQQYDIRVLMATSEDIDLDLLDLAFDEYLTKPIQKQTLLSAVAALFERRNYDAQLQEYLALRSKLALLQVEYAAEDLETNEEYRRLRARLDELEPTTDEIANADPETFERVAVGDAQ
ncbi:MAG: HoxA-like transcriptional regulator [uncultured archaeon A07HR67]|nr:MAG: HoxA-like transcriptional regulator [uncultured archaeon A07HR67]